MAQDDGCILDHLKACLLLAPWLRARVVNPGYRPDLAGLIADCVVANPSRNRELDLYPLFAYVAADALRACFDDPSMKIRPRPTFHYHLPDSRAGEPGWSIVPDWNLWIEVERLAAGPVRLADMGRAFRDRFAAGIPGNWHQEAGQWRQRRQSATLTRTAA